MNEVVLYDREKHGIRVTAIQGPAVTQTVNDPQNGESKEVTRHQYFVRGFVNGEMIQEIEPAGYRETPTAARQMFKELTEEHGPKKAAKAAKAVTREKLVELAEKAEKRAENAAKLAAKYREQLAEMDATGASEATVEAEPAEMTDAE